MKLDLSIFFLQMREAENDISRYSRLGLFVERAMVRDFHTSQAVSLAVLELPIRSLQVYKQEHRDRTLDFIPDVFQEARRTLFNLFRHYGGRSWDITLICSDAKLSSISLSPKKELIRVVNLL